MLENIQIVYHKSGLGILVANDPEESSFGGTTRKLQWFGLIGLSNTGGVDQIRRNIELYRGVKAGAKISDVGTKMGILHNLSEETRLTLLVLTWKD